MVSTKGRLLVATPPLVDANFDRTVVLIIEHNDDGAFGLVLNRPSTTQVASVLPEWALRVQWPTVVFSGGPVQTDAVIALARRAGNRPGTARGPGNPGDTGDPAGAGDPGDLGRSSRSAHPASSASAPRGIPDGDRGDRPNREVGDRDGNNDNNNDDDDNPGFVRVLGDIGTVDLGLDPDAIGELEALRVFVGYAGWGPGQLDGEVAQNAWIVLDAEPADAFSAEPTRLWRHVLGRQPGTLGWMRHYPDDVELN